MSHEVKFFCFVFLLWFALITADKRVSYKKHYHPRPKKTKQKKKEKRDRVLNRILWPLNKLLLHYWSHKLRFRHFPLITLLPVLQYNFSYVKTTPSIVLLCFCACLKFFIEKSVLKTSHSLHQFIVHSK